MDVSGEVWGELSIYAVYEEGCQERYQEGNCSGTVLFHDRSFCSMNTAGSLILIKLVGTSGQCR